jgi:small subunit ribosomal protein S13
MARIEGVDLPRDKRVEIGLTYIYGIGRPTSRKILTAARVNPDTRVRDLTEADLQAIREQLSSLTIEGDLRANSDQHQAFSDIGCYRGCAIAAVCRFADSALARTRTRRGAQDRPRA